MTGPAPGIDLDEAEKHIAEVRTWVSDLCIPPSISDALSYAEQLLAEVRVLRDREARVRALAAKWMALGGADVYETPIELGEILLSELDGDR